MFYGDDKKLCYSKLVALIKR